jgi:hypothetical protein
MDGWQWRAPPLVSVFTYTHTYNAENLLATVAQGAETTT